MGLSISGNELKEILHSLNHEDISDSFASSTVFKGVEFDSREITGGEIFIALKGEKTHGHVFVEEAIRQGPKSSAALALVEDRELSNKYPKNVVFVKDTLAAFWAIAKWWRRKLGTPIFAVTGSVGKTTVKELAANILQKMGPGCFSLKSHNNHVGVPYTLCRLEPNHRWGVLEVGMNHAGEIKKLSNLIEPDCAAITAIAPAHIGNFGSLNDIAEAKREILEGLVKDKFIILNGEEVVFSSVSERVAKEKKIKVKHFGFKETCDARVMELQSHGIEGIKFRLKVGDESEVVRMSFLGAHSALNAACAVLGTKILYPQLSISDIHKSLENAQTLSMRLSVHHLRDGKTLIDDSYNANPASMRAFLELGQESKGKGELGVIIGDMKELGSFAEKYHREIGTFLASLKPKFIIAVGEYGGILLEEATRVGIKTLNANSPEEAGEEASKKEFDILLIKASRAVGLERASKIIIERMGY